MDFVGMSLDTSLCIKSTVDIALCPIPTSYLFSGCLPTKQPTHTPLEVWMEGKPQFYHCGVSIDI